MVHRRILLVIFPAQGHINPSLQFAKQLIRIGVEVTFVTSVSAHPRMTKATDAIPRGLNFAAFSDGYDDGFKLGDDFQNRMSEMRSRGSRTLKEIIASSNNEGRPINCLVYSILLPWAARVARDMHIPSALLWIQPATVLDIYYYYFNGYVDALKDNYKDPSWTIKLPGLTPLTSQDLPSFILPSSTYRFALPSLKEHLDTLDEEINPKVLVNTFDALEPEALRAIEKLKLIAVGPLNIPTAFLDGKDPSDTSFGGDLFQKTKDYLEWLNSKPESSVVYISFGSLLVLPKQQKEEIARGLLESGRPFLWVIRAKEDGEEEKEEDRLSCIEELEQQGMIVPWCSQVEVLSHPSLGCFVTHCGWNSTLESLVCGVPVVAFPRWTDQGTNAKLIEDVWRTGVRVRPNEEGVVECDEIKRCLDMVMEVGGRGNELRENANKWKELAREAVKEGGSSAINLQAFLDEVGEEGCS